MRQRANLFDDTMRRDYEAMQAKGFGGIRFKGVSYTLDTRSDAGVPAWVALASVSRQYREKAASCESLSCAFTVIS